MFKCIFPQAKYKLTIYYLWSQKIGLSGIGVSVKDNFFTATAVVARLLCPQLDNILIQITNFRETIGLKNLSSHIHL
jgi:hypothetical protein